MSDAGAGEGVRWVRPPLRRRVPARVLRELGSRFCLDLGGDHRSTILVAGSGRSGTTWLAELINHRNEYHYIFEPFHSGESDGRNPTEPGLPGRRVFGYHQYLRPETADLHYVAPTAAILSGRARSPWTERFNKRPIARRRIVKDVHSNLILKWLSVNFPGMPIFFILRHPCAVAASRKSLSWDARWELVQSQVLRQADLVEDFMGPFLDLFESASTYVEKQVLMWCLDNYVPLKQFTQDQIHVVFYERLVADPQVELERLFSFLGKAPDPSIYAAISTPSLLSDWSSPVLAGASRTNHWLTVLDPTEIDRAIAILAAFELDAIYSEDPFPNAAGLDQVMAPAPAVALSA